MRVKRNLMQSASTLMYIAVFVYMVITAMYFAVGNGIYWLFLALALASLYDGILVDSIRERMTTLKLEHKDQIKYIVYTCVSVVCPVALVLNIIALVWNREDSAIKDTKTDKNVKKTKEKVINVKKPFYKQVSFILLVIAFVGILFSGFAGMMFETSAFSVSVTDFTLTKEMTANNTYAEDKIKNDSLHYVVTVYKPKSASATNPAPTVVVMPGFTRTKATMTQYAIELSRRGFVVFTLDPNEQGGSGYVGYDSNGKSMNYTTGANGLYYLIDYFYTNTEKFDYIDRDRIGLVGHSAGGGNVIDATQHFNDVFKDYGQSWIKAVYCSGYIKTGAANKYINLYANAALSYAYYDEGVFRYQGDTTSPEIIYSRFVNEINGTKYYDTEYEINANDVQMDYGYGNMSNGTYRIIHREDTNHCFQMYHNPSIANTISFFTDTLGVNTKLASTNQVWFGKEFFTCFAMIFGFIFIVSLSGVLIKNTKFFGLVKGRKIVNGEYVEEVAGASEVAGAVAGVMPPPRKRTNYTKMIFWTTLIITAIIACLDYIPLAYLSIKWFPEAATNQFTFVFPARMVNAVLLWATTNGLIGLVLFFGTILIENLVLHIRNKRSKNPVPLDWAKFRPLKIDWKGALVTPLLVLILFGSFYFMDQISYWLFHQDFRFLLISAAPLNWRFVVTWLEYFPLIFIFYIANSIRVNCGVGYEGWKEWKVILVSALANSIGLAFILLINYTCFFTTGVPFYGYFGNPAEEVWLYINMVFALVPMMFVLPILNRIFYKQTNRVWLGPLITSMIFVMMTLSASISFIPV